MFTCHQVMPVSIKFHPEEFRESELKLGFDLSAEMENGINYVAPLLLRIQL